VKSPDSSPNERETLASPFPAARFAKTLLDLYRSEGEFEVAVDPDMSDAIEMELKNLGCEVEHRRPHHPILWVICHEGEPGNH